MTLIVIVIVVVVITIVYIDNMFQYEHRFDRKDLHCKCVGRDNARYILINIVDDKHI